MDKKTIADAKCGDITAISQLIVESYTHTKALCRRIVGRKLKSVVEAEDVAQLVAMQVARDVATCKASDPSAFLGWVSVVARNTTYKEIEKALAAKRSAKKTERLEAADRVLVYAENPQDLAVASETLEKLKSAAQVEIPYGIAVLQGILEGRSGAEIARGLGVTRLRVANITDALRTKALTLQ